jgi:hypothetical protein
MDAEVNQMHSEKVAEYDIKDQAIRVQMKN